MFPLNTFENLCVFFLLLMIYSAAGWVGEMFYCSVGKGHICEKRGFLNGFICPIYGHGALLVLYVLHGGLKNPLLTFLAGMALTSALEYFTSWFMEAVFHMRWWDYSRKKIQLNGPHLSAEQPAVRSGLRAAVPCCESAGDGVAVPHRLRLHHPCGLVPLRPVSHG